MFGKRQCTIAPAHLQPVSLALALLATLLMMTGTAEAKKAKTEGLSQEEIATLKHILPHIKYLENGVGDKPTIQFSGVNVQVVNGAGKTASINGMGNLVIGYDENKEGKHEQTGSHNLILGEEQTFKSYAGMLAGRENTVSAPFAEVLNGFANTASGEYAAVDAGNENTASGTFGAWIGGGWHNTSSGSSTAVSGGAHNDAAGENGSISGGLFNSTTGDLDPSVSGGYKNTASSYSASVSGGAENLASGEYASVSGGEANTASGCVSSVSGGSKNTASGCKVVGDEVFGGSSVSGGASNTASGEDASVSGGVTDEATDAYGSILGGCSNLTGTGENRSGICMELRAPAANVIGGGTVNQAEGIEDSVLGGHNITLAGEATHSP